MRQRSHVVRTQIHHGRVCRVRGKVVHRLAPALHGADPVTDARDALLVMPVPAPINALAALGNPPALRVHAPAHLCRPAVYPAEPDRTATWADESFSADQAVAHKLDPQLRGQQRKQLAVGAHPVRAWSAARPPRQATCRAQASPCTLRFRPCPPAVCNTTACAAGTTSTMAAN